MFIKIYEKVIARHHDKVAFIFGQERITYRDLDHKARSITAGLLHEGLTQGDRVALRLQSIIDFAASCIGIWRAGGIVVPLDPVLEESDLSNLLNIAQPSFIVGEESNAYLPDHAKTLRIDQLQKHHPTGINLIRQANDDCLVLFTSGTTATPKGVVHTHASMCEIAQINIRVSGLNSDDVLLATSLFSTGFGLNTYVLEPLICGSTVVDIHPFHPRIALEIAYKERVTWIHTVPAVLKLLLMVEKNSGLPELRSIRLGAATLDEQSRTLCVARFGIQPTQGYGMSEVGRIACATSNVEHTSGRMSVINGIDLKIFRDGQIEAEVNEVGEIGVRTSSLCRPFYLVQNAEREPMPIQNEYFMTGDLAEISKDGLLKLIGRSKTFILTPRFKVDPGEVEDVLIQHPAITEAAVIPAAGKAGYETIKAVIVAENSLTAAEVMSYCSNHLPQGKCPQIIEFVCRLPRNKLGKVEVVKISD